MNAEEDRGRREGVRDRYAELPDALNALSRRVIGCAMEVHSTIGPGLLERLYEDALCHELELTDISFTRQQPVTMRYKSIELVGQRLDLVVQNQIVVELKAISDVTPTHLAQLVSYLRAGRYPLGLLINFNTLRLKNGVFRRVNAAALKSSFNPLRPLSSSAFKSD